MRSGLKKKHDTKIKIVEEKTFVSMLKVYQCSHNQLYITFLSQKKKSYYTKIRMQSCNFNGLTNDQERYLNKKK